MTMLAIQTKDALVNLLGAASGGEYQVIGYESLAKSAKDYEGKLRTVRAFLSKGKFPESGGSLTTPCLHQVEITLELVCTSASEIDLGVIDNPASTASQRADALAGATPAAQLADASWDEFFDLLWNTIMDGGNQWLGMPKYSVQSRFITDWSKDRLVPMGEYCILTGYLSLSFEVREETTGGIDGVPSTYSTTELTPIDSIDETIPGDDIQKTEIRTE